MARRRVHKPVEVVETGIGIYNSATVGGVKATPEARETVAKAMEKHYQHTVRHEYKAENHSPTPASEIERHEVRLAPGEDPHKLIMELAKIATDRCEYGFPLAASVDFSKAAASSRSADKAESELRTYSHRNHLGFVIMVEQTGDENAYHAERIKQLKGVVGELLIPSMAIFTEYLPDVVSPEPAEGADISSTVNLGG